MSAPCGLQILHTPTNPRPIVFSLRTGTLPDPVFLTASPTESAASALGVGFRLRPSPVVFLTGRHRLSQVPGISTHPSAPHSDAGRATPHLVNSARHGAVPPPPGSSRKTSTMKFRHSTTQLRDPLHTVAASLPSLRASLTSCRAALTERRRNVRLRLATNLCRAGVATRRISTVPFIFTCSYSNPGTPGLPWRDDPSSGRTLIRFCPMDGDGSEA